VIAAAAAVPEPENWMLSLLGLILISVNRWRALRSARAQ
jgi:hypothetical protein